MIVERIDHFESFLGLRTAWEVLYRSDPEAQYFLSWTWLRGEPLTQKSNDGERDNMVCPYIDLPDTFDRYLVDKLSSNTRQKVRRYLRKVESSSDYRLTVSTPATRARDLEILEDLWRAMWG